MPKLLVNGLIGARDSEGRGFFFSDMFYALNYYEEIGETELTVEINTPGGNPYEAFAIRDLMQKSPISITTVGYSVISSGTIIFYGGDKGKRQMSENGVFLMHNPSLRDVTGTAKDLTVLAQQLSDLETDVLDFYREATGLNKNTLRKIMKEGKKLTAKEAVEMGLADSIAKTEKTEMLVEFQPVMLLEEFNINTQMQSLKDFIRETVNDITGKTTLLDVSLQSGAIMKVSTKENFAQVGDKVSIDGKGVNDGEYQTVDNKTVVVAQGKISEIKEPEVAEMVSISDVQMYINEAIELTSRKLNEGHQTVITEMNGKIDNLTLQVDTLKQENESLKKRTTMSTYTPPAPNGGGNGGNDPDPYQGMTATQRRMQQIRENSNN